MRKGRTRGDVFQDRVNPFDSHLLVRTGCSTILNSRNRVMSRKDKKEVRKDIFDIFASVSKALSISRGGTAWLKR